MTDDSLPLLRRNQLAFLADSAWQRLLRQEWPVLERECLELWAEKRLPLVVTRQSKLKTDEVALGLPMPTRFHRKKLSLQVAGHEILSIDGFPKIMTIALQFDADFANHWQALAQQLEALACFARVYGSRGWQVLTNLPYVHSTSDIDLTIPVSDAKNADEVCKLLADFNSPIARLDGELVFSQCGDGSSVSWREWQRWREGQTRELMVRQLSDLMLVSDLRWLGMTTFCSPC